jgi:hypothetical protein
MWFHSPITKKHHHHEEREIMSKEIMQDQIQRMLNLVGTPDRVRTTEAAWYGAAYTALITAQASMLNAERDAEREAKWRPTQSAVCDAVHGAILNAVSAAPDPSRGVPDPVRYAVIDAVGYIVQDAMRGAILEAATALVAWDLVKQHGLNRTDLETLIGPGIRPTERVLGPLRPEPTAGSATV